MTLATAPSWLLFVFVALLGLAAIEDAVRLRISNWISGAILLLAMVAVAVVGFEWAIWKNVVVLVTLLALGTLLFSWGKLGGGDVKLLAASGFWFSFQGALVMIVSVFLAGGVLALAILAARSLRRGDGPAKTKIMTPGAGIPYGVAIAVGTTFAIYWLQPAAPPPSPDLFGLPT